MLSSFWDEIFLLYKCIPFLFPYFYFDEFELCAQFFIKKIIDPLLQLFVREIEFQFN
jgi:hypothetical protein